MIPDDLDKDEISLIENIQRENLKISEEANAYQRLINKNNYTHENLANIVGKVDTRNKFTFINPR